MASSRKQQTKESQVSIYEQLNKRVKQLLSEEVMNSSPFAKELYKQVRGKVKKLDDIKNIEEKQKGGLPINEDQREKLKNKEPFIQSVQAALETFEIYKKSEYGQSTLPAAQEAPATQKEEAKS